MFTLLRSEAICWTKILGVHSSVARRRAHDTGAVVAEGGFQARLDCPGATLARWDLRRNRSLGGFCSGPADPPDGFAT